MALAVSLSRFTAKVGAGLGSCFRPIPTFIICEICHKQEATVNWTSLNPSAGTEEGMKLCQACADARTPPKAMQAMREARAKGQKAVNGWTSDNPVPEEDDKSSA